MQERRSFSCPDSGEYPTTSEYINEGKPTFSRISNTDWNTMLLLRPPDTQVGEFQAENDEPSSYSPLFQSVKSDDPVHNAFQQKGSNSDIPSDENCHQCTDNTCVKIENGFAANSTNTLDNQKTPSLDDVKTQSDEKPRGSAKKQEQLPEKLVQQNGSDTTPSFKRRALLRANSVGSDNYADAKSFSTRRFDSVRLPRDPTAELQPITDPVLLQKLRDTTGLQSSELKLSPKVSYNSNS